MPPTDWTGLWAAVGAISLALMALIQVAVLVAIVRVVGEARQTVRVFQAQLAPLANRGQLLIASAEAVVEQAQRVVSRAAAQMTHVEDAVTMASEGVAHLRHGLRQVTGSADHILSGGRVLWSILRGRSRDLDERGGFG